MVTTAQVFRRKLGALLYYPFAKHLPESYSSIHLGQKQLRALCGRLMLAKCGTDVNIERNAVFSRRVTLGDWRERQNIWRVPYWQVCDDG